MNEYKPIYVLGLNLYHGATACLIKDGEIIGCVSEERFTRKKNQLGIPLQSIGFLLRSNNLNPHDVDAVGLAGKWPTALMIAEHREKRFNPSGAIIGLVGEALYRAGFLTPFYEWSHRNLYQRFVFPGLRKKMDAELVEKTGLSCLIPIDHHDCHAAATLYGFTSNPNKGRYLIMTHDAAGDGTCSSIVAVNNGIWEKIGKATSNAFSPAWIYSIVTDFMGMKIIEHEYKVMGLAPYADAKGVDKTYKLIRPLFGVTEDLSFTSKIHCHTYYRWLKHNLERHRFDWIAGAIQRVIEDLLIEWVKKAIKKTGVRNILVGGGVFMNVKANMLITELPEVENLTICPTAGDESAAIGAAYLAYKKVCEEKGSIAFASKPVKHLYLGTSFNNNEIKEAIDKYPFKNHVKVEAYDDIDARTAELLASGDIVARFSGAAEWGARALGNRSILANPSDPKIIRILNEQIKSRDFWMPFAGSILKEREKDYLINPKDIKASFMALAFRTTELAQRHLIAALHPYDFTMRPQVVERETNPSYHRLLLLFMEKTGIGGVLNTSFNLHGEPIANSPEDALHALDDSGLKYLAMGNYLISKV